MKRNKTSDNHSQWYEKVAEKIARCILYVQGKFAALMGRWFGDVGRDNMKIMVISLCLLGTFFSVYVVYDAFESEGWKKKSIKVQLVRVPRHITNAGMDKRDSGIRKFSDAYYQRILSYKRLMDSMHLKIPEGLNDSIRLFEEIYHAEK